MNGICDECGEEAVSMSVTVCKDHCPHEWEVGEACLICGASWWENHAEGYIEDN